MTPPSRDDDFLGVRRNERETLEGFLAWYRAVVVHKVEGLTHSEATRVMTPSGLCPLGVVKHLGWVEHGWFRELFAGEVEAVDLDDDSAEFAVVPGDTTESVLEFYRDEVEHARRIVQETTSLDQVSARLTPLQEHVSLRWVMVHMLEETARHAGHLDLMREMIDGRTGD